MTRIIERTLKIKTYKSGFTSPNGGKLACSNASLISVNRPAATGPEADVPSTVPNAPLKTNNKLCPAKKNMQTLTVLMNALDCIEQSRATNLNLISYPRC